MRSRKKEGGPGKCLNQAWGVKKWAGLDATKGAVGERWQTIIRKVKAMLLLLLVVSVCLQ